RSKRIGIEAPGPARPMLIQSLISQPLERGLRLGERSLPALVGGELLKDGRCKLFLLPVGEAGGGFECFPQGFRHGRDSALDGTKSRSTRSTSTVNICAQRRAQRPEREHRECPARCSVTLGRSTPRRLLSLNNAICQW